MCHRYSRSHAGKRSRKLRICRLSNRYDCRTRRTRIYGDMLKYTQRVTEFAGVDSLSVSFGHKIYKTCRNPYNNKPLLLLPSAILSPLPIADTFDDIDWICQENERVREEINSYFDLGKKTKAYGRRFVTGILRRKICIYLDKIVTTHPLWCMWKR